MRFAFMLALYVSLAIALRSSITHATAQPTATANHIHPTGPAYPVAPQR